MKYVKARIKLLMKIDAFLPSNNNYCTFMIFR